MGTGYQVAFSAEGYNSKVQDVFFRTHLRIRKNLLIIVKAQSVEPPLLYGFSLWIITIWNKLPTNVFYTTDDNERSWSIKDVTYMRDVPLPLLPNISVFGCSKFDELLIQRSLVRLSQHECVWEWFKQLTSNSQMKRVWFVVVESTISTII